jgi:phytoene dehydrogenase-like protein
MAAFDVVIVGAGHNALVCALYFAKAGRRVLVLERSADIGGALRSAELTLPGFVHDLYATNVGQFAVSPAYRDFAAEFAAAGLEFLSNPYPYATAFDDGKAIRVYKDPALTEREIAAHSIDDAAAWRDLVGLFRRTAPHFLPLFFTTLPSAEAALHAARLFGSSPRSAWELRRILSDTPRTFVDRRFAAKETKALLIPWAYHMDFGPDVPGGATFAFVAGISGHLRGLSVAKGGAGAITPALTRIAHSLGVAIRPSAEEKSIEVARGRATRVMLAGGAALAADCVVASVTPKLLFGGLVADAHLPSAFRRRIGAYRYGPATFIIHLALDRPLEWRAADDLAQFNYVHLCGLTEDVART